MDGLWAECPIAADFASVVHRQLLLGAMLATQFSLMRQFLRPPYAARMPRAGSTPGVIICFILFLAGPGFNAVRLPFSFKDLHGLPPRDFSRQTPRPTDRQIAASVLPPGALLGRGTSRSGTLRGTAVTSTLQAGDDLKHACAVIAYEATAKDQRTQMEDAAQDSESYSFLTLPAPLRDSRRTCCILTPSHSCDGRPYAGRALPDDVRVPPLPSPPPPGALCNAYLPSDSTLQRFLWVVSFYAANGFYVVLDNHWRDDDTVLAGSGAWAALWAQLVRRACQWCLCQNHAMVSSSWVCMMGRMTVHRSRSWSLWVRIWRTGCCSTLQTSQITWALAGRRRYELHGSGTAQCHPGEA